MTKLARRRPGAVICLGALASVGLLPASVKAASAATPSGARVGFWAGETREPCVNIDPENYCPRNLSSYTPAVWSALQSTGATLYIQLVYEADFGPIPAGETQQTGGLQLVQEANALGIPVKAWVTMPLDQGEFDTEGNATTVQQAVEDLDTWESQNNLQIQQTDLDLEFPIGDGVITDALAGDLSGAEGQILAADIDPAAQCQAITTYRDTISWAHEHGMNIAGAPLPFDLDDIENGTMALQNALTTVGFPPFGYDDLYLQTYRSEGPGLSSGYVAEYFKEMQSEFGPAGQVSLGNAGTYPYNSLSSLVSDVQMLAGMGATSIPIFDLDGAVSAFGASGIAAIVQAGHQPMTGTALTSAEQEQPQDIATRDTFKLLSGFAEAVTPEVTALKGDPQTANSYPDGCGDEQAVPPG